MPRNLELKASVSSIELTRALAYQCGARFQGILMQADTYFCVPHGRLKLREIMGQGAELIFYERPESTSERWSTYSTVSVPDPGALKQQLASALGIMVEVKKKRELFLFEGTRIHIDEVEGLGTFLEFEIPVRNEEGASRQMLFLREQFAIKDESIFMPSYSDLILTKTEGLGA